MTKLEQPITQLCPDGVYVGDGSFTMNGGTISGNTAGFRGVYVLSGTFTKTGGIIYGKDASAADDENSASGDTNGHAMYLNLNTGAKYRDNTAGPTVNLNSGTSDNWEP
ncbi:hypothetical protein FACS1894200_13390 [Spirochaetia bacterium]|nr:hypothetical protein FACS1894200_13380 [Spirochaetia bacterium]GHU52858.1 hypothetical protein FACS1894200_13390 [Spirochaetia bacterium]